MISMNDLYDMARRNRRVKPVYFVRFEPDPNGPTLPEYASAPITQPTKSRKILVGFIQNVMQQITVLAGRSTIGGAVIPFVDKDEEISRLKATYRMKNRTITVFGGYEGLPERFFVPLYAAQVQDIYYNTQSMTFDFHLTDPQRFTRTQQIFTGETTLAQDLGVMDKIAFVYAPFATDPKTGNPGAIYGFASTSYDTFTGELVNCIRINDEVMGYTGISVIGGVTAFTGLIRGVDFNGLSGVSPASHSAGDKVNNFVFLQGNPVDIALKILTSNKGDKSNGPYDVLPLGQGCGINQNLIDVKSFEQQRDRFISRFSMTFYMQKGTNAQEFLQKEIYTIINAYPVVRGDGRLSLKMFTVPFGNQGLFQFNDPNILPGLTYQDNTVTQSGLYNEIIYKLAPDPLTGDFTLEQDWEDIEAQNFADGEISTLPIESSGSTIAGGGVSLSKRLSSNVFARFGKGAPKVTLSTFYDTHHLEVGDQVLLNSSVLPDPLTGKKGLFNKTLEIIQKNINFQRGTIQYVLMATQFSSTKRFCAWSPLPIALGGGFPDQYASANSDQRNYGFWGNKTGPTSGNFATASIPSSDSCYFWTP